MNTMKGTFIIANSLLLFLLSFLFFPVKLPIRLTEQLNANTIRISYRVPTTAPPHRIEKGKEFIRTTFEWNNDYIKLVGNTPFKLLLYEEIVHEDFIVRGEIVGFTDEFLIAGDGIIPVFYVESWDTDRYFPILYWNRVSITKTVLIALSTLIVLDFFGLIYLLIKKLRKSTTPD